MQLHVRDPRQPLAGDLVVPSSKYHAHRALILASLAPGRSRIAGLSDARHVRDTIELLRGLGTRIEVEGDGFVVDGAPYVPQSPTVSAGSSGTTLYFMTGLAALAEAPVTVVGQKYLQRRPIGPLLSALETLGVRLESTDDRPPITVQPGRPAGGRVRIAGTLSQWISGLLLLAPFATGPTVIEVDGELNERPYLALTVDMMRRFGLDVDVAPDWRRFAIEPGQAARPAAVALPPDVGSAAFALAAAALHPSDVRLHGFATGTGGRVDHPEARALEVMRAMGVPMEVDGEASTVRVRHDGAPLRGVEIDCREMPDMLPIFSVLGAFATGTTRFTNVEHVRLKESDRVAAMLQLARMGARVEMQGGDLVCHGVRRLRATPLSSYNDHRVLMSLAVAGTRADGESTLTYPNAYRISYPRFLDDMTAIGLPLWVQDDRAVAHAAGRARRRESVAIDRAVQTPITEQVRRWAAERPEELAVVDVDVAGTRTWTWRALTDAVDGMAALLLELGVGPGEPVAFQLPNVGEFPVVALAALRIGAVCCPLMPIFRERELAQALVRSRARVLIVADRFRGRDHAAEAAAVLSGGATGVEHVLVLGLDEAAPSPLPASGPARWQRLDEALPGATVDPDALAARTPAPDARAQLLFTSGTTGEPKGVVHRFDTLTRAAAMEIEHLGLGRDDRVFVPSPLAHQTGFLYGMWLALFLGSPQILQREWDAARATEALREWDGSFVQAATPFLADLVATVEAGAQAPPLRVFVVTGAAVPRVLARRATEALGTAVCGAWGSTETCLGTLSGPEDPPAKAWGTDGRPLAGVEVRISDDRGRVLPVGQEGNFELLSRCFFEGYLDHPEWTAGALTDDGWFRTGDLGTLDHTGYLRVTGRVKDVINRGGEKVPVAEIEQILHAHPDVAEAAIVAMPDERLGERACAFVVLRDGAELDFAALRRHLDEAGVAKPYWPERLELVARLPRNPIGKVQKFRLRDHARQLRPHVKEEIVP